MLFGEKLFASYVLLGARGLRPVAFTTFDLTSLWLEFLRSLIIDFTC